MKITKNKLARIYKYISLLPEQSDQSSIDIQIDPFLNNQTNGNIFFVINRVDISKILLRNIHFLINESKCAFCGSAPKADLSFSACGCNKVIKKGFYKIKSENVTELYSLIRDEKKRDKLRLRHRSQRKIEKMARKEIFKKLWDYQNGKCFYCGEILGKAYDRRYFQIDHFKPISKEGSNQLINLRLSCRDCNNLKNNVSLNVFWTRLKNRKFLPFRSISMFEKWLHQKGYQYQTIINYESYLNDFWSAMWATRHINVNDMTSWLKKHFKMILNKEFKTYNEVLTIAKKDKTYLEQKYVLSLINKRKIWVARANKKIVSFLKCGSQ